MQTNKSNGPNIVVITYPFKNNIIAPKYLSNVIRIFEPLSNQIFVITGNFPQSLYKKVHVIRMKGIGYKDSVIVRCIKHTLAQLRIIFVLFKIYKNYKIIIFTMGSQGYLLPLLISKLLRKKIIIFSYRFASTPKIAEKIYSERLFSLYESISFRITEILAKIYCPLADQIIIESESFINLSGLNKYRDKIAICGTRGIDIDLFTIKKDLGEKKDLIGYIGRFSKEKGVINFAKAIPQILNCKDVEILMGGLGPSQDIVKKELKASKSYDKILLSGWIDHNILPDYFNELKLLVVPSYIEGLPNTMLEAMACGTPVLITPVGGVPDVIRDGETGFIMEDNSPESIARNVIRALEDPNLDRIVKNARKLIEVEYAYEVIVEKYRRMLENI